MKVKTSKYKVSTSPLLKEYMITENIKVKVSVDEFATGLEAKADYWDSISTFTESGKKSREELTNQFANLSKEEIEDLVKNNMDLQKEQDEILRETLNSYAQTILTNNYLQRELEMLEHIENVQNYFDEEEGTFNQLTNSKPEDELDPHDKKITNGVYSLKFYIENGNNENYTVSHYLEINRVFRESDIPHQIDASRNNSYSEIEEVETYINNKLKEYNYLFLVKKAILVEDMKQFNIHPRLIRELGIKVLESKEDILNYVKEQE